MMTAPQPADDSHGWRLEKQKYERIYAGDHGQYGSSAHFRVQQRLIEILFARTEPAVIMDVGCGKLQFLEWAASYAFELIGLDFALPPETRYADEYKLRRIRRYRAPAWKCDLFRQADWVCSFDMLEHLLPHDVDRTLDAMWRATHHGLILSVASCSDKRMVDGQLVELHPTQRPREWWHDRLSRLGHVVGAPGDRTWRHFFVVTREPMLREGWSEAEYESWAKGAPS